MTTDSTIACLAPSVSLYLTPRGDVQACCFNVAHPLGNVRHEGLLAIWNGHAAEQLRQRVSAGDLSSGCQACAWALAAGDDAPSLDYDQFSPPSRWPKRMELALSNRCNLACVMCHGELSSRIRARREKLPPLPDPYDDRFYEDLDVFLPHLEQLKFLGGEPLLAPQTYRVLDAVDRLGAATRCHVTTNGTQLPPRALAVMERQPMHFAVSLDGFSAEVIERVRVGVDHEQLMANLAILREYCAGAGTSLALTYCLMRENWFEFLDCLRLAEDWGLRVVVNTVLFPAGSSLFTLPSTELAAIVDALTCRDDEAARALELNLGTWRAQLEQLRAHVRGGGGPRHYYEAPVATPRRSQRREPTEASPPSHRTRSDVDAGELMCDRHDIVISASPGDFLGVDNARCTGRPFLLVINEVEARAGAMARLLDEADGDDESVHQKVGLVPLGASTPRSTFALLSTPTIDGGRRITARWLEHGGYPRP